LILPKWFLIAIAAFASGVLVEMRLNQVAHAQPHVEYKVVPVEMFIAPDGKQVGGGRDARYYSTQIALDQHAKDGWELVTASYDYSSGVRRGQLIFVKR
jgi:Domain of unknown function (DUF4177)